MATAESAVGWAGPESEIGRTVEEVREQALGAYRSAPELVEEHANIERSAVEGGYGRRQLYELIQNGADELLGSSGRIEVVLAPEALYCANEGHPLSAAGIRALLFSNLSAKSGEEIGRFGLGFKSVLGITSSPEIFSRSGSVRFDPELAREQIERTLGRSVERVPALRIARPLAPELEREQDEELAQLMSWATTVVRLQRDADDTSWLEQRLIDFPAEFLIFSPHVRELVLRNRETGLARTITATPEGDALRLREGADASQWRVFRTSVAPGPRAKRDGGTMADRDSIPVAWAVDTRVRRVGQFWAFFPTYEQTTLSGVLNAPWKLNEDRTRLIDGPFNEEVLKAACDLVLENLESLAPDDDPGALIELMPGRGRELRGWADGVVTSAINHGAAYVPSIPDQNGELEYPGNIALHPRDIPEDALEIWSATPGRPDRWVHPSVETRERRPRVEMYMEPSGGRAASTTEWLEALVAAKTAEASRAAIQVAGRLFMSTREHDEQIRNSKIVMDEHGRFVPPLTGTIFIRAPLPVEADATYVHADVVGDEVTREALEQLGVRPVDTFRLLEAHIAKWERGWKSPQWDTFWDLVRRCDDAQRVTQLLADHGFDAHRLVVRTRGGQYGRLISVLLPGDVFSERSIEDADAVIDTQTHGSELRILTFFGAVPSPVSSAGSNDEPWFTEYRREALDRYLVKVRGYGASPSPELLDFRARPFAGPATPLMRKLSQESRCRLTHALIRSSTDLAPWTFAHKSQSRYPEESVDHPLVWLLTRRGMLRTTRGLVPVGEAVGPELSGFGPLLPIADIPAAAAKALGLPMALGELSAEQWTSLVSATSEVDDARVLARAYVAAATVGVGRPDTIRCRVGQGFDEREPSVVAVTADEDLANVFRRAGDPHLHVAHEDEAATLIERWGLRSGSEGVRSKVGYVPAGPEEPLIDLFPMLRHALDDDRHGVTVQPCSELRIETFTAAGRTSSPRMIVLEREHLYRDVQLDDEDFLQEVSASFGLQLDAARITAILRNVEDQRVQQLKLAVRNAPTDATRLVSAIGAPSLRSRIPTSLIAAAERINEAELSEEQLGELALAVHGVEVLQKHKDVLEERGLNPPMQWAGRRNAVRFVRDLGFGPEFAGFEKRSIDPVLEIEGRPDIPPLHDYQRVVVGDLRTTLIGDGNGLRGLLSLPTGAGKTRVTVEALVEAMTEGILDSPILWIAQTEELCEQAVQTWAEIWRGLGPRRRLTVSRLWGSFEATSAEYGEQVVVATIQKLEAGIYAKRPYDWLKDGTSCIVVDEAHTSIGPSYTAMLEWQGMARNVDRIPLIGLTATPFRNTNVEETKRLVARYGHRRLDVRALGDSDAYPHLQQLGILSQVDHELLRGEELRLTPDELEQLQRTRLLPQQASQKLGESVDRNRMLLDHIASLDPEWPILLFAASVEHAQIMAALLSRAGILAAAISGEMDRGARRHYIKQFRDGDLRVLTNFNVLTAGFDAPKVRALYIARPTYSPNAYQQMVGRGLRGPKNGGTERCLLVNVHDNVLQFGDQLAFHEFEYLWSRNGDGTSE